MCVFTRVVYSPVKYFVSALPVKVASVGSGGFAVTCRDIWPDFGPTIWKNIKHVLKNLYPFSDGYNNSPDMAPFDLVVDFDDSTARMEKIN